MKKIETDVLVIGAGLAGTGAALAARKAGRKVTVLARESGASAMSSGALDIAADPAAIIGHPEKWSADVSSNISELLLRASHHPYRLFGDRGEKVLDQIKTAFDLVFPADGFLSGSLQKNTLAFNQLGTFKQTSFTQSRMLVLEDLLQSAKAVLIGFDGFGGFDAEFCQKNLLHWVRVLGAQTEISVSLVPSSGLENKASLEAAQWITENFDSACAGICKAIKASGAPLAILPPVIPGTGRKEFLDKIEKETPSKARELLSLPPSVPGKRLAEYIESRLRKEGVDRLVGKAIGSEAGGGRIKSVLAECGVEQVEINARAFVLASGSFLAGGISKNDEFQETVFGLDLFCGDKQAKNIFTEKLTSVQLVNAHPLFSVGLSTDADQRVLNRDGKPAYDNLLAAGAILSGANYVFDGTGAGTALASGLRAGQIVSNFSR